MTEHYAKPYAEAAFEIAKEQAALPAWHALLQTLATLFSEPELQTIIKHPSMEQSTLVDLLIESFGKDISHQQINFLRLLAENKRLAYLPAIARAFDALQDKDAGILRATVTSAFALDEKTLAALSQKLHQKFGQQIAMTSRIDPSLISGLHIKVGDLVLDTSFKNTLNQLKQNLT